MSRRHSQAFSKGGGIDKILLGILKNVIPVVHWPAQFAPPFILMDNSEQVKGITDHVFSLDNWFYLSRYDSQMVCVLSTWQIITH